MTKPDNDFPFMFSNVSQQQPRTKIRFSWKGVFLSFIAPAIGLVTMMIGFYFDITMLVFIGGITALGGFIAMFALGIYIFALQSLPEDVYRKSLQSSIEYSKLVKKLAEERKKTASETSNEPRDNPRDQQI